MSLVWDVEPQVFAAWSLPRWYGLWLAGGFAAGFLVLRRLVVRGGVLGLSFDRMMAVAVWPILVGMRLAHCVFYQPEMLWRDPWGVLLFWRGGYSSHGGILAGMVAIAVLARPYTGRSALWLLDRASVAVLLAAGMIRIGNLFNSEMLGKPTDLPWGVRFVLHDYVPRHPAQVYEALWYFALALWAYGRLQRLPLGANGSVMAMAMILGFAGRFVLEFFKLNQVPLEFGWTLNLGQLLSIPFVVVALWLFYMVKLSSRPKPHQHHPANT